MTLFALSSIRFVRNMQSVACGGAETVEYVYSVYTVCSQQQMRD